MSFLIGFLRVVLVLDCVLLILLVLVQLPKKDAGAGLAFGGGASDALFGAGAGNALTKITKWIAVTFFVLSLVLSILSMHFSGANRNVSALEQELSKETAPVVLPPATPNPAPPATSVDTNALLEIPQLKTELPATEPATNAGPVTPEE